MRDIAFSVDNRYSHRLQKVYALINDYIAEYRVTETQDGTVFYVEFSRELEKEHFENELIKILPSGVK